MKLQLTENPEVLHTMAVHYKGQEYICNLPENQGQQFLDFVIVGNFSTSESNKNENDKIQNNLATIMAMYLSTVLPE